MFARRIAVSVLCVTGAVGVFVLYAAATGSAHRPNSVQKRMAVLAVGPDRVGVRYVPCGDERIEWIELTRTENGKSVRLWRAEAEATTAALSAGGLKVPTPLERRHVYEISVHTTRGEGAQEIEDGPPRDGKVIVFDKRITHEHYAEEARTTCED